VLRQEAGQDESSGWDKVLDWLVGKPLTIFLIVVVATVLHRIARRLISRLAGRLKQQRSGFTDKLLPGSVDDPRLVARVDTLQAVLRSVAAVTIWTVALLMILTELGVNVAPLIAGAGVAGVALGFGAQTLVRDVISGFFLIVEDQFGVGDEVDILPSVGNSVVGAIEGITLRSTRVRGFDGTLWHVANGEIRRVGNRSQSWSRAIVDARVRIDADLDQAAAVLLDAARIAVASEPFAEAVDGEPEVLGVEAVGTQWVLLRLVVRVRPDRRWSLQRSLRATIADRLRAEELLPPSAWRSEPPA
jgi:small conductance mechanosensitive channel